MIQFPADVSLAAEAIEEQNVGLQLGMGNLYRHGVSVSEIDSTEDGRHAPAGNELVHAIAANPVAFLRRTNHRRASSSHHVRTAGYKDGTWRVGSSCGLSVTESRFLL